jgi:hypothetical protein
MSIDLSDVLIVLGAGLLLYGTWLVSLALFLIVLGMLLLLAGLSQARNRHTAQGD